MRESAEKVLARLRGAGHEAYLVGGCVRDILLGREPKDFDVATSARPEEVERLFPRTFAVGKAFGVILVVEDGFEIEVATFRTESGYSDGRRPDRVEFSDARADVSRRDFTINGLLLDPSRPEPLDFVGGAADLRARLIRTIGEPRERFGEDALRLMRAVRFAANLDFEIEERTREALVELAPTIKRISAERIRDELREILTRGHSRRGMELLSETGLLGEILPDVAAMRGVEQPERFHPEGDVFRHTMLMLGEMDRAGDRAPSFEFAMAVLLHDVGKPATQSRSDRIRFNEHAPKGAEMASAICRGLRMSARETERVEELVGEHMRFAMAQRMREAKLKRFFERESFPEHLELHRLDCLASHGELDTYEFCRLRYEAFLVEMKNRPPEPLLTGEDLIGMGYAPGPLFREMLEAVADERREGRLGDPGGAREFVRKRFPPARRG